MTSPIVPWIFPHRDPNEVELRDPQQLAMRNPAEVMGYQVERVVTLSIPVRARGATNDLDTKRGDEGLELGILLEDSDEFFRFTVSAQ